MKNKKPKTTKVLATLIALLMFFTSVASPSFAFAETQKSKEELEKILSESEKLKKDDLPEKFPKKQKEKVELKQRKSSNHREYLNPDGTITAEVFTNPIHFKDKSGKWENIDNNFITEQNEEYAYKNNKNKFDLFLSDDGKRKITFEDKSVEFIPLHAEKLKPILKDNLLTYKNIYPNVDIHYTSFTNGVKEDIQLNNKHAQNTFTYEVKTNGLSIQLNADKTVSFNDKNEKEVFQASSPFAYDDKNVNTSDIEVKLSEENGKTILTYTLNQEWLNEEGRSFPVTIDPTVTVETKDLEVNDTFIYSAAPTNNYNSWTTMQIGNSAGGKERGFINFTLPTLHSGAIIESATLKLNQVKTGTDTLLVDLYRPTNWWSANTLNWSNQPSLVSAPISTLQIGDVGEYSFDVTNATKTWYGTQGTNYGLVLKAQDELSNRKDFVTMNSVDPTKQPKLVITYKVDPLGAEEFWSFDNNINLMNGNYVLSESDVHLAGKGIPIGVTRTYNSRSNTIGSLGYGWQQNTEMSLSTSDPTGSKIIRLTDEDGTFHYFTKKGTAWTAPPGIYLDLIYDTVGNYYEITDKSQTKYRFNANKKLEKITDSNGNTLTYTYGTNGKVEKITDTTGRFVTYLYDTSNRVVEISGSQITKVKYAYDTNGNLIKVEKIGKDGSVLTNVQYGYDANHNLTTITDANNVATNITYTSDDKVQIFDQQNIEHGITQNIVVTYNYQENLDGSMVATKTDPKGIKTRFTMNSVGNIEMIEENYGSTNPSEPVSTTTYQWDQNNLLSQVTDPRGKNTTVYYGNDGNVREVNNPKQYKQTFSYDNRDNMTQSTGFTGETLKSYYDTKNNVTDEISASSSSSMNEYDSTGNLLTSTNEISLATNIVRNSGFEDWLNNLPVHWVHANQTITGAVSKDTDHINGEYSLKLVSSSSSDKVFLKSEYMEVEPNTKLNLSWNEKTSNVSAMEVWVEWYTDLSSPTVSSSLASKTSRTSSWVRKNEQVTVPENAYYARVYLIADTGTAWLDNVQLQDGALINDYNHLTNGNFEIDYNQNGKPDGWNSTTNINIDKTTKYEGNQSTSILGSTTVGSTDQWTQNTIPYPGKKNNKITFSGYSKSTGTSSTGGDYELLFRVDYVDGTYGWFGVDYSKTTHDWEYKEKQIVTTKDYKGYSIFAKYFNQTGTAWFDDVVVRTKAATNAMTSEYNIVQNGNFEYTEETSNSPLYWTPSKAPSTTGSYTWTDEPLESFIGNAGYKIINPQSWIVVASDHLEKVDDGKTYSASAMVKTENMDTGSGYIKISLYDSNKTLLKDIVSKTVAGTTDWKRLFVSADVNEWKQIYPTLTYMNVTLVGSNDTSGTIYFDSVRFESKSIETTYEYTSDGNYLTGITDPKGDKTSYQVDGRGNVKRIDLPNGTSYSIQEYNELDQMTSIYDSSNLKKELIYDIDGNVTEVKYSNQSTSALLSNTKQIYNKMGEITESTDQLNQTTKYYRDLSGNLSKIEYPNSQTIRYDYDAFDELKSVTYNQNATPTWTFRYDNSGNLIQTAKNGTEFTNYNIDSDLDQITKITHPTINGQRNTTDLSYNPNGVVTIIQNTIGAKNSLTTFGYYEDGSPERTDNSSLGISSINSYDEEERIKKSNTKVGTVGYNTYFEYDETGLLNRIYREKEDGTTTIYDDAFTFDQSGNIVEIKLLDGTKKVYTYDSSQRITSEKKYSSTGTLLTDVSYTFDILGNRKTINKEGTATETYEYDTANQLVSVNGIPRSYDANGNTTFDGEFTYTYTPEGMVEEVRNTTNDVIGQYTYNYEGERTKKVVVGKTEHYYYVAGQLAYITDDTNKLLYSFTRNTGGMLLAMTDHIPTTPKTYYYDLNYHGDVTGLYDENGVKVISYSYDLYGNIVSSTGTILTGNGKNLKEENPFRYASYFYDEESDLYYVKARYYDSKIGRFLTRDAVPSENLYIYAANNPINYNDESGNIIETIIDVASIGYSTYSLIKKPSWANAGYLAWDVAATLVPGMPGSYVAKGAKALKGVKKGKNVKNGGKSKTTCKFCFPAGTKIETEKGKINIEDIKIGDKVLSKNEVTGEYDYKEVIELFNREVNELYQIHINGEMIEATDEHPFYVVNKKEWIQAKNLKKGDILETKDGQLLPIDDILFIKKHEKVYNLDVIDFDTYFVGNVGIWTHNCEGKSKKIKGEDTITPGPYAKESIPATNGKSRDFTDEERMKIDKIGYKSGCHTCGIKKPGTKSGHFVPDHQKPNYLVKNGEKQSLYPHCLSCSRKQGLYLARLAKKERKK